MSKNKDLGQIHLYTGDGKGKTTAAVGLAVRARGFGLSVWFVQFLKSGKSNELPMLEQIGVKVISGQIHEKFSIVLTNDERKDATKENDERFDMVTAAAKNGEMDVLILDEAVGAAFRAKLLSAAALIDFVQNKPENLELVLTGRDPSPELIELVDYHTEMLMRKHPYETKKLQAREGIEY